METTAAGSNAVINVNREDTPNLTAQNLEMRKEGVTVDTGTNLQNPVSQRISLQPVCLSDSADAVISEIDVINGTLNSNLMAADNPVPLSVSDEINIHDQAIFNFQPNNITGNVDSYVQNVNNDVNNRMEIASNLDVSGKQQKCDTLSAAGHQSPEIDAEDDLNGGEMSAKIQVGINMICETDTTTHKEINEKIANEDNIFEKSRVPFYGTLKDNSDINEYSRSDSCEVESGNISDTNLTVVPMTVHQASQTDLEECIEDSDGLRFLSIPRKAAVTTPTLVSKPAPVINAISKTSVSGRSPVASPRVGVRAVSLASSVRPQPSVRPAYAAVSNLGNPAIARSQAPLHTSLTSTRLYSSPRFVRSRTSTDVRPAGRGTALRKLPAEPAAVAVLKSQRGALMSRQVKN